MTAPDGPHGLARGLTNYGDADFALYLRRSFATSMGYSKAMLARPVVGIAQSAAGPAAQLLAGRMMPMASRGERLGACRDCRRFWAKYRAGGVTPAEIERIEENLATTAGTCAVMGTASTMASIAEALGMALPGTAAIPAVHADRLRAAEASGQQAVTLAATRLRPSQIITERSGGNALRVRPAIAGSTNAIIHLTAGGRPAPVAG